MVSDNSHVLTSNIVNDSENEKLFCGDEILVDAYAAVQIGSYFMEGRCFAEDEVKAYEELGNGFKLGYLKWFPLNRLLAWLSLLEPALQKKAGEFWTTRIAQDLWGNYPSKEGITLLDAFCEISNIYQLHHRHKDAPGEKVVGEVAVAMHPQDTDCIVIREVDSPWTGYYQNKIWREFEFLTGAWEGVVFGFSGNNGKIVVEESAPGFRKYRICY